jgi:fused signal recognition particle receptor
MGRATENGDALVLRTADRSSLRSSDDTVRTNHRPQISVRLLRKKGETPKRSLWQRIKEVALMDVGVAVRGVEEGSLERLEQLLLEADFGVPVTLRLVEEVEALAKRGDVKTREQFQDALREGVEEALRTGNNDPSLTTAAAPPTVILIVGVNGAGKTTFIGKLSEQFRRERKRVLVAAGDTFRAGAIDQLRLWAERTGAEFVGARAGSDPAAVAFDAIDAAVSRNVDVVIVDTAGRLHTSESLMDELKKVARVIAKRLPGAPHETLLVLDGTIGQNAVQQAKIFSSAVPVTGLVVTKLDGTARGGIVIAVHEAIDVPVKFLSVGEAADDLVAFDAAAFAEDLLSDE